MRFCFIAIVSLLACGSAPNWEPASSTDTGVAGPTTFEDPAVLREAYVREFLTAGETPLTAVGWSPKEHVIPDPDLLRGLRASIQSDAVVRAVAIANAGVHPRWTFVFTEHGSRVSVVATYTFWGQVQQKRAAVISSSGFKRVLDSLKLDLECLHDPSPEYGIWLRALAYWEGEDLFVCDAYLKEGPHFSDQLEQILANARTTYTEVEEPAV
jgi:hypothetical protein